MAETSNGTEATTTASTEAPAGASGGMPQFDFAFWPGQIFWALIIFVGLYVVLSKALLPKVKAALDTRDQRIKGDMDEARRLRDEAQAQADIAAQEMADAKARAHRTAQEARSKAHEELRTRQAALEVDLNQKIHAAETQIRASRDAALQNVRGIASDAAAAISEKLTGEAAAPADIEAALDALGASR